MMVLPDAATLPPHLCAGGKNCIHDAVHPRLQRLRAESVRAGGRVQARMLPRDSDGRRIQRFPNRLPSAMHRDRPLLLKLPPSSRGRTWARDSRGPRGAGTHQGS